MSTYDKFEYDRNLKAALDLMGINEKTDKPTADNVEWARRIMARKAAFLNNAVTARNYLKEQSLKLFIDSGFDSVTLSYCDRLNTYIVDGPRGRVDCITLDCARGTLIQDLARTVVVPD